jgi:hypothetical protein
MIGLPRSGTTFGHPPSNKSACPAYRGLPQREGYNTSKKEKASGGNFLSGEVEGAIKSGRGKKQRRQIYSLVYTYQLLQGGKNMATPKQLELRIKYAKTSINSLTKKVSMYKNKVKSLEGAFKTAKCAVGKRVCRPRGGTTNTGPRKM